MGCVYIYILFDICNIYEYYIMPTSGRIANYICFLPTSLLLEAPDPDVDMQVPWVTYLRAGSPEKNPLGKRNNIETNHD